MRGRTDDDLSDRQMATIVRARNKKLLEQWTKCTIHKTSRQRYHVVKDPVHGQILANNPCESCEEEATWAKKAIAQIKAEGGEISSAAVLARAEKLAGKILKRYIRHD